MAMRLRVNRAGEGFNPETVMPGTAQPYRPSSYDVGGGMVNVSGFGPGESLIGQQITPGDNAIPLSRLIAGQLGELQGPDRGQLAAQTFNLLREQTEPAYQQALQGVGRRAATLGRIGSGVTTTELGDVTLQREKALAQAQQGLSLQAAGQTLQDRLQTLGGILGAQGQLFGQQSALRGELRGERGYQAGLEQQGFQNMLAQYGLEDQLAGSDFARQMSLLSLLGGGFGSPVGGGATSQALAGQLSAQGAGLAQGLGGLGAALPFLFPPSTATAAATGGGVQLNPAPGGTA